MKMTKVEKLDQIFTDLDSLHFQLKRLGVAKDTLDALNKLCDCVELDLREAAGVDYDPE